MNIDLTNFFMAQLPFARFVLIKHENLDWRSDALNEVLDQIKTDEPICFIEQDFLIRNENFFEKVFGSNEDFLYFLEGTRKHPAFSVVKRELIEKTDRDFSPHPPYDHFGTFFNQLPNGVDIETLDVKPRRDFFHMNGLTQNYMNFKHGDPLYREHNFLYYNFKSLQIPIERNPAFTQIEQMIETTMGHPETHTFLDKFFPR